MIVSLTCIDIIIKGLIESLDISLHHHISILSWSPARRRALSISIYSPSLSPVSRDKPLISRTWIVNPATMPKAKCLSHGEFGAILIELSHLGSVHCLSIAAINPRIRGEVHCRGEARTRIALRRIKRGLLRIYKRTRVGVPGADNATALGECSFTFSASWNYLCGNICARLRLLSLALSRESESGVMKRALNCNDRMAGRLRFWICISLFGTNETIHFATKRPWLMVIIVAPPRKLPLNKAITLLYNCSCYASDFPTGDPQNKSRWAIGSLSKVKFFWQGNLAKF